MKQLYIQHELYASQLIKTIIQIQNWSKGIETILLTSLDKF